MVKTSAFHAEKHQFESGTPYFCSYSLRVKFVFCTHKLLVQFQLGAFILLANSSMVELSAVNRVVAGSSPA